MHVTDTPMTDIAQLAFSEVLERHRGIVFRVANAYAWARDDRADLVQEIATQLWRAWPRYDPARSVTTWMYRIALNVAISHVRRPSNPSRGALPFDETLHDVADTDAPLHEAREQVRVLYGFIETLAPLDRVLLLLYLEERTTREMAAVLGVSPSNVTTKVSRLKQRIRDHLAPTAPE